MKKAIVILSFIALFVFPTLSLASFDVSLKYGSKGDLVIELQDFLTDQGLYTGKLDGRYGFGTLKAVKAFQTANDLKVDGYFGKGSRAKANEILLNLLNGSNISEKEETGIVATPLIEQKIIPVSIVNNTPINQPIINITQQNMKDLTIEDISEVGSKDFKFTAIVKDDNGNVLEDAVVNLKYPYQQETTHDNGKEPSTFETTYLNSQFSKEITHTMQTGQTTEELIFTYKPLNLVKTLTITSKE